MKGISNISAAWSEVSKSCMNGVWRKLWPDSIPDSQEHDTTLASITENVTKIAKEIGLDDVEVGDINELLERHCEELSTEDFEELAEQLSKGDTEESEADSAMPVRTLTVNSMQEVIALINKGCEIFCSNDPIWEWSSTVKRGIETVLQPYYNLSEKKKTKQTSILSFLKQ